MDYVHQGFGIEIPEWPESFHSCSYANASIQFLYNYSASRSHSNSIPYHSNSIPVTPEVYRIPYKFAQFLHFHQEKDVTFSFTPSIQLCIISYGLSSYAFLVAYLIFELWLTRVHTWVSRYA